MMFLEYQAMVKLTANDISGNDALQNWVLGLAGEAAEVAANIEGLHDGDHEMIIGELGDILWYVFMMDDALGGDMLNNEENIMMLDIVFTCPLHLSLCIQAGDICDMIKKHIYHNKPLNVVRVNDILMGIVAAVYQMAEVQGFSLSDIMQHNINKLATRHPQGFNVN